MFFLKKNLLKLILLKTIKKINNNDSITTKILNLLLLLFHCKLCTKFYLVYNFLN